MLEKLNDTKWMYQQYHLCNLSLQNIADTLKTNKQRVRRAMKKLGITLKTKSEAQKAAINAGRSQHPTEGKTLSQDVKMKIAKGVAENWKGLDEEALQQRAEKSKQYWLNMSQGQRDELLDKARAGARKAAKEGSRLEKFVRDTLTKAGYKVEYHVKNVIPNEKLELDIFLPELSVAIEIDGPSHFLPIWGEKVFQQNCRADLEKNGLLLNYGLVIVRVKQLSNSVSKLAQHTVGIQILKTLEQIKDNFPDKTKRLIEIEI
jgi:very-short-patch-repair endonuclease/predicted DNA-binding protein YlxM (UPF0122 family)